MPLRRPNAKALLGMSEIERRACVLGMNLFFGALLGANIASFNELPLKDYVLLTSLIGGAVMGLFTIAVSRRPYMVWMTILTYAVVLALFVYDPALRPAGKEQEFSRIAVTLGIWMAFIVLLRFTPSTDPSPSREEAFLD